MYLVGNHDEVLRKFLRFDISIGNILVENQHMYEGVDGKKYLVVQGDMFDTAIRNKLKWIYHLGDFLYDVLLRLNVFVNFFRKIFGLKYWSLSKFLKGVTKEAVAYMSDFEELITDYCKKRDADGIICGHIHKADIKDINGITYMNDGDWVESCTALVEHHDGHWEIIHCL